MDTKEKTDNMGKVKKIAIRVIAVLIAVGFAAGFFISRNWIIRYRSELNRFFGKGKWEYVSEEEKESHMYEERVRDPILGYDYVPGRFKNWYILYTDKDGGERLCRITNHVMKINHDEHMIFSPKRLSVKQAMLQQLMEISFMAAGEKAKEEFISSRLTEEEAACFEVRVSYRGGNPKPNVYSKLWKEPWFTIEDATAEDYLTSDLHDFCLEIRVHDYRLEELTEEEQENVLASLEPLAQELLDTFGEDASFEIICAGGHSAEYVDGVKQ